MYTQEKRPGFPGRREPVQEMYGMNSVPYIPVMGPKIRACLDGRRRFSRTVPSVPVSFPAFVTVYFIVLWRKGTVIVPVIVYSGTGGMHSPSYSVP